jgi:L-cysteine/cystine lyase
MELSMIIAPEPSICSVPATLRSAFPVFERVAYLNTGSVGPIPQAAFDAAQTELAGALEQGRAAKAQFARLFELAGALRERLAARYGATPGEVAVTGATTDGVNAVFAGLDLRAGDEILTSDEEHPGLLAPLALARDRHGVTIKTVPFAEIANEVGPGTRLVACSHVSWQTGRVVDAAALAAGPAPVLLDGAQGLGAVPVDVRALGCDYYAASGQKWLCGPIGAGSLYVRADRIEELHPATPGYQTLADSSDPLGFGLAEGAARFDGGLPPADQAAWALASLDVLDSFGEQDLLSRAAELAGRLAELLADRGLTVAPRGASTLVSWEAEDPQAESLRLLDEGLLVRDLPGTPYVRASVGAWTTEEELDRLAGAAGRS